MEDTSIEKRALAKIFYENADLIVKGDFSFAPDEKEIKGLLDKYKEAQQLVGSEMANKCMEDPAYVKALMKKMHEFSEDIMCAENAINNLSRCRRKNKVIYYINACSSITTEKSNLQNKKRFENESLEEYIKANAKELLNDTSSVSRFVKACAYDLNSLSTKFFEEIKNNRRTYGIIEQRAAGQTLEQVGIKYAVTRERVRQIEKKVGQRFVNWAKDNSIILKIVADENGNSILLPAIFDVYFLEYAGIFRYLLKTNEGEFSDVFYDKTLDLFFVGDEVVINAIQEYIEELPDQFDDKALNELIEKGETERNLPKGLIRRMIEGNYKKTGNIYHCSKLTLGKIYANVLEKHYQKGIWIYNDAELDEFRKHVRQDYGDIKLPDNNRALVSRIAAMGILCGRGIYGPKKERYISDELANRIHDYICESESPIFLTNTLYSIFEEPLRSEGVYNKYYLQGILKELFGEEFIFRRDYVSKDGNLTSVYSEIVGFIERSMYPVTKQQIVEAFPGVTEIVINFSVSDPEIINLFGIYVHSNKIRLNAEERDYIKNSLEALLNNNAFIHCKDIFEYIQHDNPTMLFNNGICHAFGLYSVIEYLFREIMEFSRPYIGRRGVKITRTLEQLHEMILENEVVELEDIISVARENYFQINSLLEFTNSCNSTHLLINDRELARLSYIGITEDDAKELEQIIVQELTGAKRITDLCCIHRLKKLNVPWTNWLIYSVILKWSSELEVAVTSNVFRKAQPIVALKGKLNGVDVSELGNDEKSVLYKPDNLENIDDLISDIVLEEIEVE